MFKVQNALTYRTFEVEDRDELLSELELLNARKQPLDPQEIWEVFYLSEHGELLEKTTITLPFSNTIDELLEGFGYAKVKSRTSFFSKLFGRKPKPQIVVEPIEEKGHEPVYEMPVTSSPSSEAIQDLEDIFEATSEKEVPDSNPSGLDEEIEEEDNLADHVAPDDKESEELVELKDEEAIVPDSTLSSASYVTISQETEAPVFNADTIMKVTTSHDVESLSTSHLQASMERQLLEEIDQMEVLIQRLQAQRDGYFKLLNHLKQFKLN